MSFEITNSPQAEISFKQISTPIESYPTDISNIEILSPFGVGNCRKCGHEGYLDMHCTKQGKQLKRCLKRVNGKACLCDNDEFDYPCIENMTLAVPIIDGNSYLKK